MALWPRQAVKPRDVIDGCFFCSFPHLECHIDQDHVFKGDGGFTQVSRGSGDFDLCRPLKPRQSLGIFSLAVERPSDIVPAVTQTVLAKVLRVLQRPFVFASRFLLAPEADRKGSPVQSHQRSTREVNRRDTSLRQKFLACPWNRALLASTSPAPISRMFPLRIPRCDNSFIKASMERRIILPSLALKRCSGCLSTQILDLTLAGKSRR